MKAFLQSVRPRCFVASLLLVDLSKCMKAEVHVPNKLISESHLEFFAHVILSLVQSELSA